MPSSAAYATVTVFFAVQFFVSIHAIRRGGGPERVAGAALLLAAVTSTAASLVRGLDFNHVAWALLTIDIGLLLALLILVLLADRFWPMWLAALQIVAIANHGVRAFDPDILNYAYWLVAGKIAYPMLFVLFAGTRRHERRVESGCREFSWTFQRKRL